MKHFNMLILLSVALIAVACSEDPSTTDPTNGTIQADSYVAIGNSVTAGVQSGALFAVGQTYSFPNLIARQIGAEFVQPVMKYPGSGELISLVSLYPVGLERAPLAIRIPENSSYSEPYNNLGVPLATVTDLADETNVAQRTNPLFRFILRDQERFGKSVLEQAMNQLPTLITLWIGNNDVLGYATSGGTTGTDATGTLPTEREVFDAQLTSALDYIAQRAPNVKVVIGNIPDIATIPFFTTVPYAISDGDVVYTTYVVDSRNGVRPSTPGDKILLTAQELLKQGFGQTEGNPLPDEVVLDAHEQSVIAQAVSNYNATIETQAIVHGYAFVDLNEMYNDILLNGYSVAGETFSTAFISGGLFSLDGIHPSSKGSGVLANAFIQAMNAHYGANIRYVDLSSLPGVPVGAAPAGTIAWSPDWRIPEGTFDGAVKMVQR